MRGVIFAVLVSNGPAQESNPCLSRRFSQGRHGLNDFNVVYKPPA